MRNIRLLREFISLSLNEGLVPGSGDKKTNSSGGSGEDEATDETGTQSDASGHPDFEDDAIKGAIVEELAGFLTAEIKNDIAIVADDINDSSMFEGGADAADALLNLLEKAATFDMNMRKKSIYPLALSYIVIAADYGTDTVLNDVLGWFGDKWKKNVDENILRNTSKQQLNELIPAALALWWGANLGWTGTLLLLTAVGLIGNEALADGSLSKDEMQKLTSLRNKMVISFNNIADYAYRNKMTALAPELKSIARNISNGTYDKNNLKNLKAAVNKDRSIALN